MPERGTLELLDTLARFRRMRSQEGLEHRILHGLSDQEPPLPDRGAGDVPPQRGELLHELVSDLGGHFLEELRASLGLSDHVLEIDGLSMLQKAVLLCPHQGHELPPALDGRLFLFGGILYLERCPLVDDALGEEVDRPVGVALYFQELHDGVRTVLCRHHIQGDQGGVAFIQEKFLVEIIVERRRGRPEGRGEERSEPAHGLQENEFPAEDDSGRGEPFPGEPVVHEHAVDGAGNAVHKDDMPLLGKPGHGFLV